MRDLRLAAVSAAAALASLAALAAPVPSPAAAGAVTVAIEAEAFPFPGDWEALSGGPRGASGGAILFGGISGARNPAVGAVELPRAGRYRLWVRSVDFPDDRPGARRLKAAVAGREAPRPFGMSGKPGWTWEPGGEYDLPAGLNLISFRDGAPFARVDAVLLTTDLRLTPHGPPGASGLPRASRPARLPTPAAAPDPFDAAGPITDAPGTKPVARIESAVTRVEWVPAHTAGGLATVRPRVWTKSGAHWRELPVEAAAETYAVVAGKAPRFSLGAFYPTWEDARSAVPPMTVTAGGVSETTLRPFPRQAVWAGGAALRFTPRSAAPLPGRPDAVRLDFYPSPEGALTAEWELAAGERAPRVRLTFTPKAAGSYALGYAVPWRKPLGDVPEVLLPPMYQRRRFPDTPVTVLDSLAPTPLALAQTAGAAAPQVWGVIGDPDEIPFAWPDFRTPHFGLMIRDGGGLVHPAIYGPIPGTGPARREAGQAQTFRLRVLAQDGDWYAGYRTAADEVFRLRDYRRNLPQGSLTDAALNMLDLVKEDNAGGWWEKAKAPYQIESRNGSTHAAPLVPLSLYYLTGDEDLYRRRVLPTLEFLLSRNGAHFSPAFDETATYPVGGMDGPPRLYGTAAFAGLWEMTGRRTTAYRDIAFPPNAVKPTGGYSHAQEFDDWLARYEVTGEPGALRRARALADAYLDTQIRTAPTGDLGSQPFFLISFVPDWEGLLRLYEVTGDKRYLDGAVFGARQLMTGVWTQPLIPEGDTVVNAGGQFAGERSLWWKGPERYRLGSPRKPGDTPERPAPAWRVSNVGLGFEQPSTYRGGGAAGQMIYQAVWAPAFLRLARYTGDRQFETYARNAVLGRWANYPGYYATGLTDIPLSPRYPYEGPDVTSIYYHHILPHLGWTIDYLVSEAELRSNGDVAFPSLRQFGYAYFDGRVFGHKPGRIGPIRGAWLWPRRGLVTLDNPQINYLTAHADSGRRFVVLLMNETDQPQPVHAAFDRKTLGLGASTRAGVLDLANGTEGERLALSAAGVAAVTVPARGLAAVSLDGCRIDVPAAQRAPTALAGASAPGPGPAPSYVTVPGPVGTPAAGLEGRAAVIQVRPGPWVAYFWCAATRKQARRVTLRYRIHDTGAWQIIEAASYPFEFSVPVADAGAVVRFRLSGERADGAAFSLPEASLAAPAP